MSLFEKESSRLPGKPKSSFLPLLFFAMAAFIHPALAGSVSLSPSSGPGGTLITANSAGFTDIYDTGFYADGAFQTSCATLHGVSDKEGNCSVQFRAPYGVGPHPIRAANS